MIRFRVVASVRVWQSNLLKSIIFGKILHFAYFTVTSLFFAFFAVKNLVAALLPWPLRFGGCAETAETRRTQRRVSLKSRFRQAHPELQEFFHACISCCFSIDPQNRFCAGATQHQPG